MKQVSAFIVDDEDHNRKTLQTLLATHCPDIHVVGEAWNADEAFQLITKLKPQLVFLDVMMPKKSGFDLLKMFREILFEVIFVSAYSEHAVTAFEYNALGYILKPVDFDKLRACVSKALLRIGLSKSNESVLHFVNTLDPRSNMLKKVVIHQNEKVILVDIADIVSVVSEGDISRLSLLSKQTYISSKELKLFEGMFSETGSFARISKNTLLNLTHLHSYDKGEVCVLKMNNGHEFAVSRRKKAEILSRLNRL